MKMKDILGILHNKIIEKMKMKFTKDQKQKICDLIEESLNSATMKYLQDEDGNSYPLVDKLTPEEENIIKGEEEIANLVEQIYFDMDEWDI